MTKLSPSELYVPEPFDNGKYGEYVRVLIPVLRCSSCNCKVVRPPKEGTERSPFDDNHWSGFEAQILRTDIKLVRGYRDDDPVCAACWESGKVRYECKLCRCMVPSDQVQQSVGDDHLCVECYRTLPAKTWCEKLEALYNSHRYDNC